MQEQILIFDTTLRDGEQALAHSLNAEQKLEIALALEELGVDLIEAGFPISSPGEAASVSLIASRLSRALPVALARVLDADIDAAGAALRGARHFRIHTFIATSELHLKDKLRKDFSEVLALAVRGVRRARNLAPEVEFSCEDAGRTPIDRLCAMIEAAISAGATTINIPDTVGYTLPEEFARIITQVKNRVPNIDKAVLSVHTHNDLGLATANALAGLAAGARQVEGTINGLGERAGNTALEEVVMAIKTRADLFENFFTKIKCEKIAPTSRLVERITHEPVGIHKAIVGANAFSHSSGIHQDGVLKNAATYEIITPASIGLGESKMPFTARSGRMRIRTALAGLGYAEADYDLDELYPRFAALADERGQLYEYDLEALIFLGGVDYEELVLESLAVSSQLGASAISGTTAAGSASANSTLEVSQARARICLKINGASRCEEAGAAGPVEAAFKCLIKLTGLAATLKSYSIKAQGEGANSSGRVDVGLDFAGRIFQGRASSPDVLAGSVLAFVAALNAIYRQLKVEQVKKGEKNEKNSPAAG